MQSVSGGGHWGGGMFINSFDMARFGYLFLRNGKWGDRQLVSEKWIQMARTPGRANDGYGYANWFLNTNRKAIPSAPATAVTSRTVWPGVRSNWNRAVLPEDEAVPAVAPITRVASAARETKFEPDGVVRAAHSVLPSLSRLSPLRAWLRNPAVDRDVRNAVNILLREQFPEEPEVASERHESDDLLKSFVADMPIAKLVMFGALNEQNLTQLIERANADSTGLQPGADPYRRRIPTFRAEMDRALDARMVALGRVRPDPSEFRLKYEPGHPSADANGNVKYPNVNSLLEMTDMRDAQRSYEANINVITATRRMIQRTIDILKS